MKNLVGRTALLIVGLAILVALAGIGSARMIGTNPTGVNADPFCVGGRITANTVVSASEVCVDATGNVIPTTTGVSSLGTSALYWLNGFITSLTVKTTFTPPSLTTTQVQAATPSAVGQVIYNSTLNNVCVSTGTTIEGYKMVGTASTACQ